MTAATHAATHVAPAAEAVLNADGEVMVLAPDPGAAPLDFSRGPGGLLRLRLPEGGEACLALPPEALDAAELRQRLLLVHPGPDGRPATERWVHAG